MSYDQAAISHEGEWWLPGSRHSSAGGILQLGNTFQLRMLGDPTGESRPLSVGDELPLLYGYVSTTAVTLADCMIDGSTRPVEGDGSYIYRIHTAVVFFGGHVDPDTFEFREALYEFSGLRVFMDRTGIVEGLTKTGIHAAYSQPQDIEIEHNGTRLTIRSTLTPERDGASYHWMEGNQILAELAKPEKLATIDRKVARPIQLLLDLATDTPNVVTNRRVKYRSRWLDVRYYTGKRSASTDEPDVGSRLFSEAEVSLPELLPPWMDFVERVGSPLDILFALDRNESEFVANKVFNAASAAEGYHRQLNPNLEKQDEGTRAKIRRIKEAITDDRDREWAMRSLANAHRPSLATRLRDQVDQTSPAVTIYTGDIDRWIKKVVEYRNLVGHGGDRNAPRAMNRIAMTIQAMLRLLLLQEIGFNLDTCAEMLKNNPRWATLATSVRKELPEFFEYSSGAE